MGRLGPIDSDVGCLKMFDFWSEHSVADLGIFISREGRRIINVDEDGTATVVSGNARDYGVCALAHLETMAPDADGALWVRFAMDRAAAAV